MTQENSDAQKSSIHEATEDASSEPTNRDNAAPMRRPPGMTDPRNPREGGTPNAAGSAGAPPASNFERGAADRDIELTTSNPDVRDEDLPGAHVVSDESDFGGPVKIETEEEKRKT